MTVSFIRKGSVVTNLYYTGTSVCRKVVIPDNLFECNYDSYSLLMERYSFIVKVTYNVAINSNTTMYFLK